MKHDAFPNVATREELISWYRSMRDRTERLFGIPTESAYYERPIALRNPIVFYEGHLPAFSVNTLTKAALGERGIDEALELLFARGIDPESEEAMTKSPADLWPTREAVRAYAREADRRIEHALQHATLEDDRAPLLHDGEAAFTILEHELMHQ